MASFKGVAWNCAGLKDSPVSCKKALYFEKEYKNHFDIAFFLETHHRAESEIPREILRYQNTHHIVHSTVTGNETYAGKIGLLSSSDNSGKNA